MTVVQPRADREVVPAEIDRWNWGAFLLNWIWGIGNNTFIALLTLVPFVGFVMLFVLGARGSAWAWRNGRWDDVAHFKRVQRRWAIWGVVIWLAIVAAIFGMVGSVFYGMKKSEAYKMAVMQLNDSAEARAALGTPIETGIPGGSITVSPNSGLAALTFTAKGPKGSGQVAVGAVKKNGVWILEKLMLQIDGSAGTINLLDPTRAGLEAPRVRLSRAGSGGCAIRAIASA